MDNKTPKKGQKKTIKTADYTRRAVENYRKDKKQINVIFSADQWERMQSAGIHTAADVRRVVLDYIEKK